MLRRAKLYYDALNSSRLLEQNAITLSGNQQGIPFAMDYAKMKMIGLTQMAGTPPIPS